jgi:hypothetical protein
MHRGLLGLPLLLMATAAAAACSAQSGAAREHLVELYTSEGCDSCPPAERWMSTLRKHADLIGLEFHVDYWDTSDWRDPFSDHAYTLRQKALAQRGNRDQIFTPQIWLDGQVWNNWPKAAPPDIADVPAPRLTVSATLQDDALELQADVDPAGAASRRIFVALSESALSEQVRGGENRGKTLRHDEVVRAFAGPLAAPHAQAVLRIPPRVDRNNAALVAFVDDQTNGNVVQALRLSLSECAR